MNTIVVSEMPATPWRNGGGLTRELLAWPSPQDWRVRISVAQVDHAGPFSAYPGVERWFAVLSGAGVRLSIDGATHELGARSAPLRFDGGAACTCELADGPTTDLNLMLRGVSGSMQRLKGPLRRQAAGGSLAACLAAGVLRWKLPGEDASFEVDAPQVLWMEVQP